MKKLALLLLLTPIIAAEAQDSTITGKWKLHQSIAGNESDSICTFTQKDAVLTGTCSNADQATQAITGSVDGAKVKWSYKSDYNGTALTISFVGTLSAGKITGENTVDPFGITGDFTAVPATDAK
jgi:hypothetical protein